MISTMFVLVLAFICLLFGIILGYDTIHNADYISIKEVLSRAVLSVVLLSLSAMAMVFVIATLGM